LSQKLGGPEPKTGGEVVPDFDCRFGGMGDRSHCAQANAASCPQPDGKCIVGYRLWGERLSVAD